MTLAWEGPQFINFGMAVVNRELCRELAAMDDVELTLITEPLPGPDAPGDGRLERLRGRATRRPVDVHVRHEWPPQFVPPLDGRWVLAQPWEFGSLPRAWVEPMNRLIDEIWVPSHYVRSCYIRSGVDPRRVVVIPYGVDRARFNPGAPPRELPTAKRFRFLFVGGTLARKGADLLLDAYLRTFRRDDDVCLVVKDLGAESFYRGQTLRDRLRALAADPRVPEVLYIENDLAEDALPGLYTACHCLVHPYRGEGFGLPILEAMACGLAVIVPSQGPAPEFCDRDTTYFVPAAVVQLAESRVGTLDTVDRVWFTEVDRGALALAMREVADHPDEARERGRLGGERARANFGWDNAARLVRERVRVLTETPIRRHGPAPSRRRRALSVCMIVRNEEHSLPACIASVRDVADEIVVVDTGSTDRTMDIAREHGARVFEAPWTDDFAAVRNVSLDHATGDYILVIDGDQTLEPTTQGELGRLIQHDGPYGYLLRQLNYTAETGSASVVEHLTVRLFRNHPAIRYVGRIHEQVASLDPDVALELVACGVVLHHHGYRSASSRLGKAVRDLPILERIVAESPSDVFAAYNLGVTYQILGRFGDAEAALQRAIAQGGAPGSGYLLNARVLLAASLLAQTRSAEAAACCREALAIAPEYADAWCTLGSAELNLGRHAAAAEAFRRALGCAAMPRSTLTDHAMSGWRAWCGLGQAELLRGDWPQALSCFHRAAALNPGSAEILHQLDVAVGEGLRHRPDDPELLRTRAEICQALGDLDGALGWLQRALGVNNTDAATLSATGDVLLALGAAGEAEMAYRAALACQPDSVEARRKIETARAALR